MCSQKRKKNTNLQLSQMWYLLWCSIFALPALFPCRGYRREHFPSSPEKINQYINIPTNHTTLTLQENNIHMAFVFPIQPKRDNDTIVIYLRAVQ